MSALDNVCSFTQFASELRNKAWPSFRQAGAQPHPLGCMDFVPTNCHINFMQVSYPKTATSAGRTFSIRFGRKNSLFGLDPDQGREERREWKLGFPELCTIPDSEA